MPTKRLTQGLVSKFNILTGAKYLSSGIFQNYSLFIPAKKYIKISVALIHGNLIDYQKKILKI